MSGIGKEGDTAEEWIQVKGARTHNLRNVDVSLPRGKFVVISGVSGSGKSSLAFDTLYAEGQRRYVESLSSYARQYLGHRGHGAYPSETVEVPAGYLLRIKRGGRYLPLILKPYLLNFFSHQIRAETMPARGNLR